MISIIQVYASYASFHFELIVYYIIICLTTTAQSYFVLVSHILVMKDIVLGIRISSWNTKRYLDIEIKLLTLETSVI